MERLIRELLQAIPREADQDNRVSFAVDAIYQDVCFSFDSEMRSYGAAYIAERYIDKGMIPAGARVQLINLIEYLLKLSSHEDE